MLEPVKVSSIWDRILDLTVEFRSRPLHRYLIDFDVIIDRLNDNVYETPREWFDDVHYMYRLALSRQDPKIGEAQMSLIVQSLWEEFSKKTRCLDSSSFQEWAMLLKELIIDVRFKTVRCPFPYLIQPGLFMFLNSNYDENWPKSNDLDETIRKICETNRSTENCNSRDLSQYLVGAIKDKVVNMNDYDTIKEIGRGAFAVVTLERHKKSGSLVAIKTFVDVDVTERTLELFYREVTVLALNHHSCVLPFLGFSCSNRQKEACLIIVTEFLENGSLRSVIEAEKQKRAQKEWNSTKKSLVAFGIAFGMTHLHKTGVIHRDLKSPNILMDSNLLPKIADLGLSKYWTENELNTSRIGSCRWMAPEVMITNEYTEKADVYSFSLILFELLTLNLPYQDCENLSALVSKVITDNRPMLPKNTPPGLVQLIKNCWQRNSKQRPSFETIVQSFLNEECLFPGTNAETFLIESSKIMGLKEPPIDIFAALSKNYSRIVEKMLHSPDVDLYSLDSNGNTPFHIAVINENLSCIHHFLKLSAFDVNVKDSLGRTVAHTAIINRIESVLQIILSDSRFNLNSVDVYGKCPIHYAVEKPDNNCLYMILTKNDVNINISDLNGNSPLHIAVEKNCIGNIHLLLSRNDINPNVLDVNNATPLIISVRKNFNTALSILLSSGKVDVGLPCHSKLLNKSIRVGNIRAIQALLQVPGININGVGCKRSPLARSVLRGDTQIMMLLFAHNQLDLSADIIGPIIINAISKHCYQFLHIAISTGKVDFNCVSNKYPPPLVYAVFTKNTYVVSLLLGLSQINVNIQTVTWPGHTPLHFAAQIGNIEITNMLLASPKINPNMQNSAGQTPLMVAMDAQQNSVVGILKNASKKLVYYSKSKWRLSPSLLSSQNIS